MPLVNGPNLLQLAAQVRALSGWRRMLCAALLGGLAAFALPPFHFIPLLIPAFAGLVWLLEGAASPPRARRRAIGAGFWFGFGHFFIGLHWIIEPMLVAPERTAWMIPFAWPGLAAVLAIFPALVCWAQSFMRCGDAAMARVLAFAALWTLGELLRGYVFTGFPWNLIGYSWSAVLPVMQITAAIGVLGLGFVTIRHGSDAVGAGQRRNVTAIKMVRGAYGGGGVARAVVGWRCGTAGGGRSRFRTRCTPAASSGEHRPAGQVEPGFAQRASRPAYRDEP